MSKYEIDRYQKIIHSLCTASVNCVDWLKGSSALISVAFWHFKFSLPWQKSAWILSGRCQLDLWPKLWKSRHMLECFKVPWRSAVWVDGVCAAGWCPGHSIGLNLNNQSRQGANQLPEMHYGEEDVQKTLLTSPVLNVFAKNTEHHLWSIYCLKTSVPGVIVQCLPSTPNNCVMCAQG